MQLSLVAIFILSSFDYLFELITASFGLKYKCKVSSYMDNTRVLLRTPAKTSTSDQRCFNVVDQRWNNVDRTLKMKQNPTSDFQRWTTLIQRQCPTLKQRWNNVETTLHNVGTMLIQRCFHLASTLVKIILNPIGLVMIMDLPIHE